MRFKLSPALLYEVRFKLYPNNPHCSLTLSIFHQDLSCCTFDGSFLPNVFSYPVLRRCDSVEVFLPFTCFHVAFTFATNFFAIAFASLYSFLSLSALVRFQVFSLASSVSSFHHQLSSPGFFPVDIGQTSSSSSCWSVSQSLPTIRLHALSSLQFHWIVCRLHIWHSLSCSRPPLRFW